MIYQQLSQEEIEYIAHLMCETETTFQEVNWRVVEIIGKGRIDLQQDKPVYGEPTLKERLLGRPASRITGTMRLMEGYNMVVLLGPYEKEGVRERNEGVTLSAGTTYSVNIHCEGDNTVKLEGRLYGPNHYPDMTHHFRPDTVVFPLKKADLAEILAVQETKC